LIGEDEIMGGQSFIGALITMFVIFLVISFAITLLPYILIGILILYVYRRLIRPLFAANNQRENINENKYYKTNVEKEEDQPVVNQVKSVHDDVFFKQEHKVVDVDYDEDNK